MTFDEFNTSYQFEAKAGFSLSDLQKQDIDTLYRWGRSLNRYEVGGGKTVVSTAVSLMNNAEITLVIALPILLIPWEHWLNRVSENVLRYQGTPPERGQLNLKNRRWIVMSYAIFRKDFERIFYDLKDKQVDVIVDEAQALKSPTSILYKKVGTFAVKRKLQLLTGTPTSKPLDCYTYIRLTNPSEYRSHAHFLAMHVAKRDFFGAVVEYQNLDILADKFALRSIKRTKEELHGYDNRPLYPDTAYELSSEHIALYNRLLEEQLLCFDDGSIIDATTATRMYHAMQQIVVNYDHFSGDPTKRSNTYDLIDLTIEQTECSDINKSKLIIWTYYKLTSRSVLSYLLKQGINAVAAYSEVDSNKSFEKFMHDSKCRVLVAQPGSAGAGLNPQDVCSEMLFIETSTTPMQSRQAIGRIDRMGQRRKPTIRFAVAENTIQGYLLDRLMHNDEQVSIVERTKLSLKKILQGAKPA